MPPPQLVFVPGSSSSSVRVVAGCVVLQDEQDKSGCAWRRRWSYKAGMGGTSLQGVEADVSASCIYKRECRTEGGRGRRRIQGGSSVRVLPLPFLPLHRSPAPARATDIITRFGYHNDCHIINSHPTILTPRSPPRSCLPCYQTIINIHNTNLRLHHACSSAGLVRSSRCPPVALLPLKKWCE